MFWRFINTLTWQYKLKLKDNSCFGELFWCWSTEKVTNQTKILAEVIISSRSTFGRVYVDGSPCTSGCYSFFSHSLVRLPQILDWVEIWALTLSIQVINNVFFCRFHACGVAVVGKKCFSKWQVQLHNKLPQGLLQRILLSAWSWRLCASCCYIMMMCSVSIPSDQKKASSR